jgi:hypothetical protein
MVKDHIFVLKAGLGEDIEIAKNLGEQWIPHPSHLETTGKVPIF